MVNWAIFRITRASSCALAPAQRLGAGASPRCLRREYRDLFYLQSIWPLRRCGQAHFLTGHHSRRCHVPDRKTNSFIGIPITGHDTLTARRAPAEASAPPTRLSGIARDGADYEALTSFGQASPPRIIPIRIQIVHRVCHSGLPASDRHRSVQ
jgi:hypothetical protein